MKKKISLLVFTFLFISFMGCESKREAIGEDDQIIVFADSANYEVLEPTLIEVFSREIYTPQRENLFLLKRENIEKLPEYNKSKNIIIISPLSTPTVTTKYIEKSLDSNVVKLVQEGKEFSFIKKDVWAKHQVLLFLTANTNEELQSQMLKERDNLLYYFKKASDERLASKLFKPDYEKKEIAEKLSKEYDWSIYVQADYVLAKDDSTNNFVWLRRGTNTDLERWVFVKWWDNVTPELLTKESAEKLRNEVTKEYFYTSDSSAHIEIADDYLTSSEVNFNGHYAIMTQGLWRMTDRSMGGPFVNYLLYDEGNKRLYMLDGSIYAPKYFKKKIIQQIDVLLHTFKF